MSKFWGNNLGFHHFEIFNPVQISGNMDDVSNLEYMKTECEMYDKEFLKTWERFLNA